MGGEQDWIICTEGRGAKVRWESAPWKGSAIGHSLSHLVHRHDVHALITLWRECSTCHHTEKLPSAVVRFATFALEPFGDRALRTCRYETFELRLYPLQKPKPDSYSGPRRALVIGAPQLFRAAGHNDGHGTSCGKAVGLSIAQLLDPANLWRLGGVHEIEMVKEATECELVGLEGRSYDIPISMRQVPVCARVYCLASSLRLIVGTRCQQARSWIKTQGIPSP